MGWLDTTLTNIFSWFKVKSDTGNPTKQTQRRPQNRDITESLVINRSLTCGLYHNSYPGLKLAGALAFTPIAVPVWFMGIPVPLSEDEKVQEILNELTEQFNRHMDQLHVQCHREGTIWVFPKFSSKKNELIWEFIHDDCVSDIVKDLETGDIIKIITDEEIVLSVGENLTATVRRKRYYTKDKIEIKWMSGKASVPNQLKDKTYRNPIGMLPIPFSNNADADESRGHSDYERIISDLKDYHDIDLKQSLFLSKFEPKLHLKVEDVNAWLENNGEESGSLSTLEVFSRDILFSVGEETAEYIYPERAYQAYDNALKRKFRKIVEGSGVPELLWNIKIEGNHASAQEQMNNVVKFVEDKRSQKNEAYTQLFEASINLILKSTMTEGEPKIAKIEWNTLDSLSDEVKAKVLKDFSQAMAFIIDKASATKEMIFEIWNRMLPGTAPEDFEEFKTGLAEMAKHRQFVNSDYAIAADQTGLEDLEDLEDLENDES